MNLEGIVKRLEALEGKLSGSKHIESIIVGIPGRNGKPAPCFDVNAYTGDYVVLENVFYRTGRIRDYKPEITRINDYRDYNPAKCYENAVIYLVRRKVIEIHAEARKAVEEALQAVKMNDQRGDTES